MLTFIAILALGVVLAASVTGLQLYRNFNKHIQAAKSTGLNYITAPFPNHSPRWVILNEIILPTLREIPFTKSWRWLDANDRQNSYLRPMKAQNQYGDTYCSVSPNVIILTTCNAELITQVTQRKNDFLKPVRNYKIIDIFGSNIVTKEGADWRRHKRIVGHSFSEKSNKLVFEESLRQANSMLGYLTSFEGNSSKDMKVTDLAHDAATLSLHIICAAGFGLSQLWPGEKKESATNDGSSASKLSGNHTLTFKDGMEALLQGIRWLAIFPPWVLRSSPFKGHNLIYNAYAECLQYFEEIREDKKMQMYVGEHDDDGTMDLMGPMIRASDDGPDEHDSKSQTPHNQSLSTSEVIGNSFIFFFAGHETTANSIHYSIIYLATDLFTQRRMQSDIDRIVGSKPTSSFSYQEDMPRLYNSLVGAVLNEQLRLMPAILNIPKEANGDQVVTVDELQFVIPNKTHIQLSVVATNRNPRYWPHSSSKLTPETNDLNDFVPERWLMSSQSMPVEKTQEDISDGLDQPSYETSSPGSLFNPAKGTFITFSEGWRACPGRRFAQVEVTAVLTGIFQRYSVELDVREWASDEEITRMGREEKIECYEKAVERARTVLKRCEQKIITLQLRHGDRVPIRFVERGCEIFAELYE